MKFRIEVICVSEDGAEQRSEVRAIERQVASSALAVKASPLLC
jgi:hypothetical protein